MIHKSYKSKPGRLFWQIFDQLPKELRDELNNQAHSPTKDDLAAAVELAGSDFYSELPRATLKAIGLGKLAKDTNRTPKKVAEAKKIKEKRRANQPRRSPHCYMNVYGHRYKEDALKDPFVVRILGEDEVADILSKRDDAKKVRMLATERYLKHRIRIVNDDVEVDSKQQQQIDDYFERAEKTSTPKVYHNAGRHNGEKGRMAER